MIFEMTSDDANMFIETHLPINIELKKDFGEVFTPYALINKMLDELPEKVWSRHDFKWLEPTCGTGNFMLLVYLRLMNGLKGWESCKKKRSDHIIRNMLYMVELNLTNVEICRKVFGETANIVCGDFLDESADLGNRFNVIVGNLPFQNKSGVGAKSKLYEKMTLKCLDILLLDGYMLLITPDNIFSGGSKVYKRMVTSIACINLDKSNQQYFPKIQQYICYFLFCRERSSNKTKVVCNDGSIMEIVLKDRPINPVRNWSLEMESLICKYISSNKNGVVYNRGKNLQEYMLDDSTSSSCELIFTPKKHIQTNNPSLMIGLGVPKVVVFSISIELEFAVDLSGSYGVGPNTFYVTEHLDKWIVFLKSEEYKKMALATKTNRQFLKNNFIHYLDIGLPAPEVIKY